MTDAPEPDQVIPQAKENGTIKVPIDIISDDVNPSAEELAKKERLDRRISILVPIIDNIIPERTIYQVYCDVQRHSWYLPDKSEPSLRANAEYKLQEEIKERKSLAFPIAYGEIPEKDFENYVSNIYFIANEIAPTDSGVATQDIKSMVFLADNPRDAIIFKDLATKWKENFLSGSDNDTIDSRKRDIVRIFNDLSGAGIHPRPEKLTENELDVVFNSILDSYELTYSFSKEKDEQKIASNINTAVTTTALISKDSVHPKRVLEIFRNIINSPNRDMLGKFTDIVGRYVSLHEITEDAVPGFSKLYSVIEKGDSQLEMLTKPGNIFGMRRGDYGAGDFLMHCYDLKVTPQNLSELLLIFREIPTNSLAVMEQNRLDGLSLAGTFGSLRDFIHDQRPYVHDLLKAMVDYYDTKDKVKLDETLSKTDYFKSEEYSNLLRDLSKYDNIVTERTNTGPVQSGLRAIDILRRLEKNTEPVPDENPKTSDPKFDEILKKIGETRINEVAPKEILAQGLDYVNSLLEDMMKRGEIGIEPNHIHAIAWLERRAFDALHNLSFEEQSQAYMQPWFVSILKFQELTCSPKDFNKEDFQNFISRVQQSKSDREAYQLIGIRALESVYQLAKIQSDKGRNDTGGLWSGNLPHELIGLVDPKPSKTEIGRKAREEEVKKATEPGFHPGD